MEDRQVKLELVIEKILKENSRFLIEREIAKIVQEILPVIDKYVRVYVQEEGLQKPF